MGLGERERLRGEASISEDNPVGVVQEDHRAAVVPCEAETLAARRLS